MSSTASIVIGILPVLTSASLPRMKRVPPLLGKQEVALPSPWLKDP